MALHNNNYSRDAVYIYGYPLENQQGLKGHYFTLNATGRDTISIDEDTGKYTPRVITVNYVIDGATPTDFQENLDYLAHLLSRVDADISFNDDFDKFLVGDVRNLGLKEKHACWGLGSYEIRCEDPLKYDKTIGEVTATQTTSGEQTFVIPYEGTAPTHPVIDITPGASQTAKIYTSDSNLEFINIKNTKSIKSIAVGSSYPDGSAEVVCNYNFKTIDLSTFVNDGWMGERTNTMIGSKTDPYYDKGTGLTYKALYPTSYDTTGSHDEDDPADTNRTIYKSLSTSMTNFICAYGLRMWADSIIAGGSVKLVACTTDNQETGIVIYKNSLDSFKGKVLYYINGKVMGSDTIDLSKYSHSFGLTDRQSPTISRYGKIYFNDEVVNNKRLKSSLVEQKVSSGYIYIPSNNNIVFSKLGETYTFKVGDLPVRRFNYMRESGTDIGYNQVRIGFKSNMISTSYDNLNIEVTGIDILSVSSPTLLNNWGIMTAGSCFEIDPSNLELTRAIQNTSIGVYAPEYVSFFNNENSLVIDPKHYTTFKCVYYNKTAGNDPEIKARYNTAYV